MSYSASVAALVAMGACGCGCRGGGIGFLGSVRWSGCDD